MTKSLLRNSKGNLINIENADAFTVKKLNGVRGWTVWFSTRTYDFYENIQPLEYAFITKWTEAREVKPQLRNDRGQFAKPLNSDDSDF